MFFSTKGGPDRIQIIKILFAEPKKIQTIASETKMSYYHVRYHVNALEQKGFVIKKNNAYIVSQKFNENYHILDNITNQKLLIGDM